MAQSPQNRWEMFDEKQFYLNLKNAEEKNNIHESLKILKSMDIPHRLIEEVVETVEVHLRCEIHWKTAMLLVRQLETKAKYPDLSQYAPNLEDSESMQRGWRMARLQRMDEIEWIKRKEKRVEIELFTEENQKKVHKNGKNVERNCKKIKKKHKKRTRKKHYSRR